MGNLFGTIFKISTFGESHGKAVGVVIDGCPAGITIDVQKIQHSLDRRRPGQSHLSSPRAELDKVEILSGLSGNKTLGTPISMLVHNKDKKESHYKDLEQVYRPSHADYTTEEKFGIRPASGGGRASARETIGRVAAAAVAEQALEKFVPDLEVVAWVEEVKGIQARCENPQSITRQMVDKNPLRCPSLEDAPALEKEILKAKKKGDSVGGVIFCGIKGCPVGLGEPVFDKLEADLAKAVLSLPASKGFEIGSGFLGTTMYGSEHNDAFYLDKKTEEVRTKSNRSGGIQGGISNGEFIYFRTAFKPVATIFQSQDTVTVNRQEVNMKPRQGRHDPCVLPRAVPMVEAMAVLTIMDHYLRQSIR